MKARPLTWLLVLMLVVPTLASGVGAHPTAAQDQTTETTETTDVISAASPVESVTTEATATDSATATETQVVTEPATATATATETGTPVPTETAPPTDTATATASPTEAPIVGAAEEVTPDASPNGSPAATPSATATPEPPAPSEVKITLSCTANPEQTRIDNLSPDKTLLIYGIGSLHAPAAAEPYQISPARKLGPGRTVIYRSNSGATTGTVLTINALYTNGAYDKDGAIISTSAGDITAKCPAAPPPPPPSLLTLSMTCNGWPEKTTIKNVGLGPVKLHSLWTSYNKLAIEPIALSATLNPGQSITYQSGGGATANRLTASELYTENAGTAEKLTVKVSTGKVFTKSCPPGPKWIEVNLSTQYLTAWEGYTRIGGSYVSTGKDGFWTPPGTFYVNTKLTSQTMAGCIQGECYNVPNVPWVMYFTNVGHAIHGAYWHNEFGIRRRSHGCVNLPVPFAEWLYWWTPYGTKVVIHY